MNLGRRVARRESRRRRAGVGQTEAAFFEGAMSDGPAPFAPAPPFLVSPPSLPRDIPPGSPLNPQRNYCGPPGSPSATCDLKMIAKTLTITAGGTGVFRFTTPGAFCPVRMYIISDDIELMFVLGIKSGLEEQILGSLTSQTAAARLVPAQLFSIENDCCPVTCLPCICQPAVPFEVTIGNGDVTDEDVTVILVGTYLDATDPRYRTENGCPPRFLSDIQAPGCPPDGGDKLLGLSAVLTKGIVHEFTIETPGRFCPRQLFFLSDANLPFIHIATLKTATRHHIISGRLPATLFSLTNECCVMGCLDCTCMPGVPLTIGVVYIDPTGEGPAQRPVVGALVGSYEDACQ